MNFSSILLKKVSSEQEKRRSLQLLGKRGKEPNLKSISDSLDHYYFFNKLSTYCAFLSYQLIIDTQQIGYQKEDFQYLDQAVDFLQREQESFPIIKIYLQIKRLYESIDTAPQDSDQIYKNLWSLLIQEEEQLDAEDQMEILSFFTNFCIWKMNNKDASYISPFLKAGIQLFHLKAAQQKKMDLSIPASLFRNMVMVAINFPDDSFFADLAPFEEKTIFNTSSNHKLNWVDHFIEYFSPFLLSENQPIYYPYCKSLLEFEKENYTQAYLLLKQIPSKQEAFTGLSLRLFYLKVIFEIYTSDPSFLRKEKVYMKTAIESFRSLIRYERSQKKKMAYQLQYFENFEKLLKKVLSFHNKYEGTFVKKDDLFSNERQKLIEEVSLIDYHYKPWLLKKINTIAISY